MILTQEHRELQRSIRNLVDAEINPFVDEWEAAGIFPAKEVFKKLAGIGALGISKPESCGGLGLDYSYELAAAEAVASINCGSIPMAVGVQTNMATPALAKFGDEALQQQFLAPAIAGDYVAAIAVSETGAGSDVANLKTRAEIRGDNYHINGSKMWITNSTQADFFCLLANTSEGQAHRNKSLIIVPADVKGVSCSPRLDKLGMRSSDTAQVFFDDVVVPVSNRIGKEGDGFSIQMMQFQEERMCVSMQALVNMESCLEQTIEYCRERQLFGIHLLDNQVIHYRFAELKTEMQALRALIWQACESYINNEEVTMLASMAKLKAGRLVREATDACLQYWGGMGFMWDNPVGRAYRDMRLTSIGGGADEVMLAVISKLMGILPRQNP